MRFTVSSNFETLVVIVSAGFTRFTRFYSFNP